MGELSIIEQIEVLTNILECEILDLTLQYEDTVGVMFYAFEVKLQDGTIENYMVRYSVYEDQNNYVIRSKEFFGVGAKEGDRNFELAMKDIRKLRESLEEKAGK